MEENKINGIRKSLRTKKTQPQIILEEFFQKALHLQIEDEYPFLYDEKIYFFDIYIPSMKIVIEYLGAYYHKLFICRLRHKVTLKKNELQRKWFLGDIQREKIYQKNKLNVFYLIEDDFIDGKWFNLFSDFCKKTNLLNISSMEMETKYYQYFEDKFEKKSDEIISDLINQKYNLRQLSRNNYYQNRIIFDVLYKKGIRHENYRIIFDSKMSLQQKQYFNITEVYFHNKWEKVNHDEYEIYDTYYFSKSHNGVIVKKLIYKNEDIKRIKYTCKYCNDISETSWQNFFEKRIKNNKESICKKCKNDIEKQQYLENIEKKYFDIILQYLEDGKTIGYIEKNLNIKRENINTLLVKHNLSTNFYIYERNKFSKEKKEALNIREIYVNNHWKKVTTNDYEIKFIHNFYASNSLYKIIYNGQFINKIKFECDFCHKNIEICANKFFYLNENFNNLPHFILCGKCKRLQLKKRRTWYRIRYK